MQLGVCDNSRIEGSYDYCIKYKYLRFLYFYTFLLQKHNLITLNELKNEVTNEQPEEKVSSTTELGKDDLERMKHLKIIKKQNASKKIK